MVLTSLCLALVALVSCRSAGQRTASPAPPGKDALVVASFNFSESQLLAEIYAGALEAAGVPVDRELSLGPRELVEPALRQGLVDLVPEYLGSALRSVTADAPRPGEDSYEPGGPDAPPTMTGPAGAGPAALRAALSDAVAPWGLQVMALAEAQNQNGLAVTRETAEHLGLHALSDLAPAAGDLVLTGPPECPARPYCLPGLVQVYGLHFASFVAYETEAQRVAALQQHIADVAVVFTTDGQLATDDLRLLVDDRGLQPPENVVPVMTTRAETRWGPAAAHTVDAVSGRLTSGALRFLNWRVGVAGRDVRREAQGWLQRQGLAPRPG
jgi:osmoprotectant transport system substrate-binding protein